MDQLEAMRAFAAIADAGSLSAAARALGIPVPTVSRKLAALEAHVGARLVSRTTRRMALTEAGQRYLEMVRRVVTEIEAAERSLSDAGHEPRGMLSVTAPIAFGRLHVLPVVADFLRAHPAVDVCLALADHQLPMIEEGIDVAIRIGALPDSSLLATRVGSVRRITCASPAYLREHGTPARPEDLAAHACITFTSVASPGRWLFPAGRGARGVAVRSRLTVGTAEAAVDAAVAGLGVTRVLSYQAQAAIEAGRLTPILERYAPAALPVSILHGEGREPRPKLRAFLALATSRLREALR